ncbi:hypothetical protein OR263_25590 [Streptomyces sp. NEAU-H22]|uniref:hypothetical protein n=1 Tax=Streptomyces sp. NEAU-H22 TaxID=2994655 RepID=UPI00225A4C05|nr:hypothetical protein [Streptomyces sp. NEAU-H22]MCX3290044.1 hypothetical protein [Streptomyces sp. NEAU-H22]
MAVDRWVVVSEDPGNKTILGGAYVWDGETAWTPPVAGTLLTEADALAAGYSYPPPEGSGE